MTLTNGWRSHGSVSFQVVLTGGLKHGYDLAMDLAEKDTKPLLQPFHVFLGDGRTVAIEAASFQHEMNAEEQIIFVGADGAPIEQIFLRAKAVDLIVPDSALAKTHSFVDLQNKVSDLAERLDRIEQALTASQPPLGG